MSVRGLRKTLCILILLLLVACGGIQEPAATPTSEATAEAAVTPSATPLPPTSTPTLAATATAVPDAAPPPFATETVSFTTQDGIQLAGTLFGDGETAVILAHQGNYDADQTSWHAFAQLLAERGFTALTLDFRGVGQSGGTISYGSVGLDLDAALRFLRKRGFDQIVCAGASMGGTACARTALDNELSGLIVLASTMRTGMGRDSVSITPEELANLTLPKLFVTADKDSYSIVDHTKRMHDLSPEPKSLHLLPGTQHGTDLFDTEVGDDLTAILLEFLESLRNETSRASALLTDVEGSLGTIY